MKKNNILKAAAFAAVVTSSIYIINKSIFLVSNAKATLSNSRGRKYDWRFGNIFYTVQGEGKPILLIHDLTCGSSDIEFKSMTNELAKTHTVYTMDLLGCGRSDKPNLTYTNFLYVQLVTDFIKNVIGHRTDVVVTGASSPIVLMSCFNDDTLYDKIMLINPDSITTNNQTPNNNSKILKVLIELPIIGTLIYNIRNSKQQYICEFKTKNFANPYIVKESLINDYYSSAHFGSLSSKYLLSSIKSNFTKISITRAVKDINNSICILGGELEPDINDIIADYKDLNPSIESAIIPNTKHLPQLERAEEVITNINIFFN